MKKTYVSTGVLNDVRLLPVEEIVSLYGIEVAEDGTVFDPTENQKFANLNEWAMYIAERENEDNYGSFSKIGGRHGFDDEDY